MPLPRIEPARKRFTQRREVAKRSPQRLFDELSLFLPSCSASSRLCVNLFRCPSAEIEGHLRTLAPPSPGRYTPNPSRSNHEGEANVRTIGVIEGDGVGPEVLCEALACLERAAPLDDFRYELRRFDLGADRYLRTGEVLPESEVETLRACDAILLGAVGDPRVPPRRPGKRAPAEAPVRLSSIHQPPAGQTLPGCRDPRSGVRDRRRSISLSSARTTRTCM